MATMTICVPEPVKDWIETQVKRGRYASPGEYLDALVRRDVERAEGEKQLTIDDLRQIVDEARAGGVSTKTFPEILADAKTEARRLGLLDG